MQRSFKDSLEKRRLFATLIKQNAANSETVVTGEVVHVNLEKLSDCRVSEAQHARCTLRAKVCDVGVC